MQFSEKQQKDIEELIGVLRGLKEQEVASADIEGDGLGLGSDISSGTDSSEGYDDYDDYDVDYDSDDVGNGFGSVFGDESTSAEVSGDRGFRWCGELDDEVGGDDVESDVAGSGDVTWKDVTDVFNSDNFRRGHYFRDEGASEPASRGAVDGVTDNEDAKLQRLAEILNSIPVPDNAYTRDMRKALGAEEMRSVGGAESGVSGGHVANAGAYARDTLSYGGKTVSYRRAMDTVDWGTTFVSGDKEGNMGLLCERVTKGVYHDFGGWGRVHSIMVYDYQLIINGVCYMPRFECIANDFPFDVVDYIKNGCLAPFFDWSCMKRMPNLVTLVFDSYEFVLTWVGDGIGLGRKIGVSSFFRICPKLNELYIGGEGITRGSLNTQRSGAMKHSMAKTKRFTNIMDGFRLDVYGATGGFRDFTVNNLRSYATNRGNKGLIRYLGGVGVLSGLALGGVVADFGTHFLGGILKTVKGAIAPRCDDSDLE